MNIQKVFYVSAAIFAAAGMKVVISDYQNNQQISEVMNELESGAYNCWGNEGPINQDVSLKTCSFDKARKIITYNYVLNAKASDLNITPEIEGRMRQHIKSGLKSEKATRSLARVGFTYNYRYASVEGYNALTITFNPSEID